MDLKSQGSHSSLGHITGKMTVARKNSSPETFAQVLSLSNCETTTVTTVTECKNDSEMQFDCNKNENTDIESQELTYRAHFIVRDFTKQKIKKTPQNSKF